MKVAFFLVSTKVGFQIPNKGHVSCQCLVLDSKHRVLWVRSSLSLGLGIDSMALSRLGLSLGLAISYVQCPQQFGGIRACSSAKMKMKTKTTTKALVRSGAYA